MRKQKNEAGFYVFLTLSMVFSMSGSAKPRGRNTQLSGIRD